MVRMLIFFYLHSDFAPSRFLTALILTLFTLAPQATDKSSSSSSSAPQRVVHHLKHLFDAPTCPVTSVIVYTEKAEVSRFLR